MIDLCLRFPDEAVFLDALRPLGMTEIEDSIERVIPGAHAIDVIGEIPGHPGYHANLRILADDFDTSALAAFEVHPTNPVRVWAA